MSTTHWEILTPADEAADAAQDAAVSLSERGRYLAYGKDDLLSGAPKSMTSRTAIFVGAALGLVASFGLLVIQHIGG